MTLVQKVYKFVFIVIVTAVMAFDISAQNNPDINEDLKTKANALFEKDQYVAAFPLYSQLLSLERDNHELQYRFGVCLLYSDRSDTYAPIKYLNKALNHIEASEIYYFLGFAHHINYNFPSAISYYQEYQNRAGKKQKKSFDVQRKIEMCQNGMGMMRSVKDLFVLDKSEVARNEFFRSYDLRNYGGKMIQKPDEFLTKEDEKQDENSFLFFNSKAQEIYYSAYDKGNKDQKDIFKRSKTEEGGWSPAIKLPETINTPYDEDFPVLMPDGVTLYFSSKGHSTIGGYDIFKSTYNPLTKTWSEPLNINFPFNTPVDDILFVPDTLESTAWFASVRNSVEEKIMVYKVGIVKRPQGSEDLAAIYAKNKELTEADLRAIKDRARLDVNISEQEYDGIHDIEDDSLAKEHETHQQNLGQLSDDLINKQQEQAIIDSAKYYVQILEKNIDSFDSLRQKATSLASSKRLESKRIREDVKASLAIAASANYLDGMQKAVNMANQQMMSAERLDFDAAELDSYAREIKQNIDRQRETFIDINTRYGDAEQAVINGSKDRALAIIAGMNNVWKKVPQPEDVGEIQLSNVDETIINIQYPNELNQQESYQAFVVNSNEGEPQIETFNERYQAYIPSPEADADEQIETSASTFSNNPSIRLQEYINTLGDTKKSIDIQIGELNENLTSLLSDFQSIPEYEKQSSVDRINELEKEKGSLSMQREWIASQVEEKQNQLNNLQLSSLDVETKIERYQQWNQELEQSFDFDKKIIHSQAILATPVAVTFYNLTVDGTLTKQTQEPQILAASELEFDAKSKGLIENQATQMLAETRKLQKENQFLQRKIQSKIDQLKFQANESFNGATLLLENARKTEIGNRQIALDQANVKYREATRISSELKAYQQLNEELSQAVEDQSNLILSLQTDQDAIENTLKQNDFDAAEIVYQNMEKTYQNNKVIGDFSSEVSYNSGEIIQIGALQLPEQEIYQITVNGDIVKTIGDNGSDWESFESFSTDISKPTSAALVLSPNVNLSTRQAQFSEIFTPVNISQNEQIQTIIAPIPDEISSSENSLIINTVNQINNLESKANILIRKRNQLNTYYQITLVNAASLEDESLSIVNKTRIDQTTLEQANEKARLSKVGLYKASVAANIIRQYDEQILRYTNLINQSLATAHEMNDYIEEGNQDDALLRNVQLQREIIAANENNLDESSFNFAVNEVFTEVPEIFEQEENQEFVIVNGQVQRNDQAKISQFFYQNTYPVKTQITDNSLLVISSQDNSNPQLESSNNETTSSSISGPTVALTNDLKTPTDPTLAVQTNAELPIDNTSTTNQASATVTPFIIDQDQTTESGNTSEFSQNVSVDQNSQRPSSGSASVSNTAEIVSLQSFNSSSFTNVEDFREALSKLNSYAQNYIREIDQKSSALTQLAESKLIKSNNFSMDAENNSGSQRKMLQDSAKLYLYEAMAIKDMLETFEEYANEERAKQEKITQGTFRIESSLKDNDLNTAKDKFIELQKTVEDFDENPSAKIGEISLAMQQQIAKVQTRMDSAYNVSQVLANKSVQFLSEAAEERETAEDKRSAFKRREHLKIAEDKELEATRLQNESEKALNIGNQLYQEKEVLSAFILVIPEINQLQNTNGLVQEIAANQLVVFENIESRKAEVLEGQLSTTIDNKPQSDLQNVTLAKTNDIHVYQRENFKAEMISEELDLLKREIALLVQSQNQSLPERETYIINQKIKLLRQKADSLEYEANKAFKFAKRVLESLSAEEQMSAQESGRDFDNYLSELKGKIEILLSEAASLKQRAQRSNNIESRESLFSQAKEKEEVAMYLILEEFEVIAQKNKTRYRRNQLILEQLLMENASPEERALMRNIFAQIDDYFAQADAKRKKANQSDISFSMKKILLQDAYSLEMKALDMQQQAKTMIENKDRISMMAYQKEPQENLAAAQQNTSSPIIQAEGNESVAINNQTEVSTSLIPDQIDIREDVQVPIIESNNEDGVYYRVQFVALKEIKNTNDFPGIVEVSAQRVRGTNYIRYFSGEFDKLEDAVIRRNSIRGSRYKDAFIKSWRNGEEVNLLSLNDGNTASPSTPSANLSTETQVNNIDFSATNISSLQGVYYTVQVGIYSRPRTSALIFGIAPLYHKRMDNGYWIYYSGIFKSIANAEAKKQDIIQKGVSDAFIVAFSNGEQVSLANARQQISRGSETPSDDAIVILEDASSQLNQQWNQSQSNTVVPQANSNESLVYKVQVGVYSNPVNLNWISSQLDDNNPVDSYQNSTGKYVYTVGEYSTESEARALLNEVSDLVSDAFLVGFQNGQKKYIR